MSDRVIVLQGELSEESAELLEEFLNQAVAKGELLAIAPNVDDAVSTEIIDLMFER